MLNIYDGLRSIFFGDQNVYKEDLQNIEYTKIKTIRDTIAACIYQPGVAIDSLTDTALQYTPAIAVDGSNNFIITWEDGRNGNSDIYAQRYDYSGSPSGSNFKVNDDVGTAGQKYPAIAVDGSGNFIITWQDHRNFYSDIFAQRYNFSGTPLGSNFKVNDDAGTALQGKSKIAVDGSGNFIITWQDYRNGNSDIYAQRYDYSGSPSGSNFKVNDDVGTALQYTPAIAVDGSGNFIITWQDHRNFYSDIYAQRYDYSGSPSGSNFKVNDSAGTALQYTPAIAVDGSGNFIITWEDGRNVYFDIFAQRYNFSGTPLGSNFKVNDSAGTALQGKSKIAVDGSGNFIITWEDGRNGNSDIYAQRYDYSGSPSGSNFKVNDDVGTAGQKYPAIAVDGSGNFIITWEDGRNVYSDIFAQRYNFSGTPLGSNFKVNDSAGNALQVVGGVVSPGTAIDKFGRIIYVPDDTAASGSIATDPHYHPAWPSTTVSGSGGYVNIYYDTQQDIVEADDSGDQYYTRTYDSYRIVEEGSLPSDESGGICLLNGSIDCRPFLVLRSNIGTLIYIDERFNFMVYADAGSTEWADYHYWIVNSSIPVKKAEIAFQYNGESLMNVRFCSSINSTTPGILYLYVYNSSTETSVLNTSYSFSAGLGIYNFSLDIRSLSLGTPYYIVLSMSRVGSSGITQLDAIVIDVA